MISECKYHQPAVASSYCTTQFELVVSHFSYLYPPFLFGSIYSHWPQLRFSNIFPSALRLHVS